MRRISVETASLVCVALVTLPAGAQAARPADGPADTHAPNTRPADSRPADTQASGEATQLSADLGSLTRQLSNPDWHQRRAAREALVRLGDDAKPALEALVQTAPEEETRHQAQEALGQIEENRTLGPSYITLHVKNARPEEVFAEISRQCHATMAPYPDNLWSQGNFPPLSMDVERQPFWEVVPKICQRLGVDFRQYQTGLRLMRTGMNAFAGIGEVDGAFLVIADRITYTRTRLLGAGRGENDTFSMNLTLYPEPKVTLLRGITNLKLIEAVDDHGNSMLPATDARSVSSGGFGAGAAQLFAPLKYPRHNPGTKIARFRASANFNVQTRSRQIQIADLMRVKNYHVTLPNMEITVKEMIQKEGEYELKLGISSSPTAPPDFGSIYAQLQSNLRILDGRGAELPRRGINSNPGPDGTEINVLFGVSVPGHTPEKLLWEVPVESRQITVPIHFTDIPLFEN